MVLSPLAGLLCLLTGQIDRRLEAPYEVLPVPAGAAHFASHLDADGSAVWLKDDVLTIVHRDQAKSQFVLGTVNRPMLAVPGTDLWVLPLRMKGWDKAFLTYAFEGGDAAVSTGLKIKNWRGPHAPPLVEEASHLQGAVSEKSFRSESMGEERKVTVYLPPKSSGKGLPVIFMADGNACEEYAKVLEPLILRHKVRPVAIVGVHTKGYQGDRSAPFDMSKDYRGKEYVTGIDEQWYAKHFRFFTEEVPAWATREFGLSTLREDRSVLGMSNGGQFAEAVAVRRPDLVKAAMAMSPAGFPDTGKASGKMSVLFYAAGTLEPSFPDANATVKRLQAAGASVTLMTYVSGHDALMWHQAFARAVQQVFPAK